MKRMTIPAMLVAAVLAFALAGCAGNANETMTEDTLKGVWKIDSQTDMGFDAYLSFGDDSMFEMILADSYLDGTWSVSGTSGTVDTSDDRKVSLSYAKQKLTMGSADGSKLVFVKDDSKEAKEMFEDGADVDVANGNNVTVVDENGNPIEDPAEDVEMEELEYVDEVINPIDPVTVVDDGNATIVVTAKGTDFTADPAYWMTLTNKTDRAVYFAADEPFKVGDKEVDPGLGDELEAGETLETSVYFPQDELGGGLDLLTNVNGTIIMYDSKTDDEIARYPFHMD